jgi:hypothetical protein
LRRKVAPTRRPYGSVIAGSELRPESAPQRGIDLHHVSPEAGELLLEAMIDRWHRLQHGLRAATVTGDTLDEWLLTVLDLLARWYGTPEYLAYMQIFLDLSSKPATSEATRDAVMEHGRELPRASPRHHRASQAAMAVGRLAGCRPDAPRAVLVRRRGWPSSRRRLPASR